MKIPCGHNLAADHEQWRVGTIRLTMMMINTDGEEQGDNRLSTNVKVVMPFCGVVCSQHCCQFRSGVYHLWYRGRVRLLGPHWWLPPCSTIYPLFLSPDTDWWWTHIIITFPAGIKRNNFRFFPKSSFPIILIQMEFGGMISWLSHGGWPMKLWVLFLKVRHTQ